MERKTWPAWSPARLLCSQNPSHSAPSHHCVRPEQSSKQQQIKRKIIRSETQNQPWEQTNSTGYNYRWMRNRKHDHRSCIYVPVSLFQGRVSMRGGTKTEKTSPSAHDDWFVCATNVWDVRHRLAQFSVNQRSSNCLIGIHWHISLNQTSHENTSVTETSPKCDFLCR